MRNTIGRAGTGAIALLTAGTIVLLFSVSYLLKPDAF